MLLIGVTHVANSTIHVGEAHARMPYLPYPQDRPASVPVRTPSGDILAVRIREQAGHSGEFDRLDAPLRARGAVRETMVGQARCQLISGLEIIAATGELLARNPLALLCESPDCPCCQSRRRAMAEEVRS
jgi:aminoglycoside 3-N-acetyltransferase